MGEVAADFLLEFIGCQANGHECVLLVPHNQIRVIVMCRRLPSGHHQCIHGDSQRTGRIERGEGNGLDTWAMQRVFVGIIYIYIVTLDGHLYEQASRRRFSF